MSDVGKRGWIVNPGYILSCALSAFLLCNASPGKAETAIPSIGAGEAKSFSMEELRAHAATIEDILVSASAKVELLAASKAEAPAFVDAIKQEISLSRRWNRHLESILVEVAEARRELGERERQAAKDIARMTAVAEEARLELMALKDILEGYPERKHPSLDEKGQDQDPAPVSIGTDDKRTSNRSSMDDITRAIAGPTGDLHDARKKLASMKAAQTSAFEGVHAVRGKIIAALETLAAGRNQALIDAPVAGEPLSSKDITSWAASMATKLNQAEKGSAN